MASKTSNAGTCTQAENRSAQDAPCSSRQRVASVASVASAFIVMAWLSWRKWPDLLIDFGLQLYIPWQLSEGSVLYRDIAHLPGGPFSQYFNALLFSLFGVSFNVLLVANFVLLILLLALVYRGFCHAASRLTATMVTLTIIVGFALSQYLETGNYNYISPYSHEVVHGLVFSVLLITCLSAWLDKGRYSAVAGAGFCFGIIFLTKPDIFIAATVVVAVAFYLQWRWKTQPAPGRAVALFFGSFILPALGFFFYFLPKTNAEFSLKAALGAWTPLFTSNVTSNHFYRWCMGLDLPWENFTRMIFYFAGFTALLAFCAWRLRRGATSVDRILAYCLMGAVPLLSDWTECGRPLPLITVCGLGLFLWRYKVLSIKERQREAFILLWILFSLFLLAKMGLYSRVVHYGFALGMPAFAAAVYLVIWLLPQSLERFNVDKLLFRQAALVFVVTSLIRFFAQSELVYREKNLSVGPQGDRIVTTDPKFDPTGAATAEALDWIAVHTNPDDTLAVLPEGAMINYLSRRRNPTPYLVFMAEVPAFGEDKMFAAYKENPPDYIALVHRNSSEYGFGFFGSQRGYGLEIMEWINASYSVVQLFGKEPLQQHGQFGIKIMKRNDRLEAPPRRES